MTQTVETWTIAVEADTSALQEELNNAAKYGRQFGAALSTAFEGVALKGRSLGDVVRTLALSLSQIALRAAFKPLEQGIGDAFANLTTGFAFAKGGAIQAGLPMPFAAGGVIASPVTFPMANGRLGLAGENGAEAIMPLARGPDGRLGVRASGDGSSGGLSVTFNVTTPDAESFRRSEAQVSALLARAVAQGQRNL